MPSGSEFDMVGGRRVGMYVDTTQDTKPDEVRFMPWEEAKGAVPEGFAATEHPYHGMLLRNGSEEHVAFCRFLGRNYTLWVTPLFHEYGIRRFGEGAFSPQDIYIWHGHMCGGYAVYDGNLGSWRTAPTTCNSLARGGSRDEAIAEMLAHVPALEDEDTFLSAMGDRACRFLAQAKGSGAIVDLAYVYHWNDVLIRIPHHLIPDEYGFVREIWMRRHASDSLLDRHWYSSMIVDDADCVVHRWDLRDSFLSRWDEAGGVRIMGPEIYDGEEDISWPSSRCCAMPDFSVEGIIDCFAPALRMP